ncbi:homoserine kinase [Aeromicrobium wangtongii]|uniref:Homoserine kinase n=1 Tax=Aeromicrobium wangtongii TaxID=2969247 RepID=A0ABY5M7R1_9ACTN|nr:homoserine kinase [Aeromicrobium wangtongii]MCD9199163.1 homoserine kinase [Aeromicrobium wangtongii]UUP12807.1 homoserine kinase [Aeromicrobium wangtongii]
MSFVDGPVTVRVPASSANLGPGFDALGLAVALHDEITAEVIDDGLEVRVSGEGKDGVPLDETHLVVEAMHAAFDLMGGRPPGLRLTCVNVIPHGRGLGSSAAAIVGGIVLARAMVDGGDELLDDAAAYQLAVDLEGHPDNVAAAFFGGLTIAWIDGAAAEVERLTTDVDVTVFIPPSAVSTAKARGLLPETVPHRDAALNAGRSALLVAALTGRPHRLISATEDRIHQSYRAEAMPDSYKLLRQLRVDGVPTIISGAGPTVLAFARGVAEAAPQGWTVHELAVDADGATVVRP